ncbi:uracil-DNA glycosylase [[Candida] jaroonii]|uniref:Uracil-DNA glycosylase n=1 Tax=[Candida] jaroonii TaxID=467808 RepID=A0ACA9Y7J1_9ASCO|nr:uracil-DNA glycosylase [[Candida] jaroonii]
MKRKITDFFQVSKKVSNNIKSVPKTDIKVVKGSDSDKENIDQDNKDNDGNGTAYEEFAKKNGFDKTKWLESLNEEHKELLDLEINNLHISWLTFLHKELTKPYFLNLKKFLKAQQSKTVFPPKNQIYSWSHYTPLPEIKCLVLGQDPYHNFNQAHGLAFSVLEPTKPPPSLKNIYKTIQTDYPKFEIPNSTKGGGGNLTKWAERGVLLLNTCLTVEAHKPNSHSKHGWETFTQKIIETAINFHLEKQGFVVMAWGMPAQNTLSNFKDLNKDNFLVIKTFHPSPFSAAKGFFTSKCFKSCNEWLQQQGKQPIDWSIVENNSIW